jgi:hypothetical protein
MRTKITLVILFLTFVGYAQNGIDYKAVIKDDLGNIVAGQSVGIQFTILEGATNVYQEAHNPTTDANGITIINIGEGTVVSGDFAAITWGSEAHFLKVDIDIEGGIAYEPMATTQFKSVPYAITANKALTAVSADTATNIELPYYDEANLIGAAFHIHNDFSNTRYGIAGSAGTGAENLPANNAGVIGQGDLAHGVYGVSKTSIHAGVQGVSESPTGVGIQGYGFGGGVGGHFYTTSAGVAALTTGTGNVGIGIDEPEYKLHMGGDLFVQTSLGSLKLGFPDNGSQWQIGTLSSGSDLQFRSKVDGSSSFTTRYRMRQNGEFQVGNIGTPTAWVHIEKNSTLNKPHLKLEENGNDYARLELTNDASNGAYWQVAGLPSTTASSAKLNFYFRNASESGDKMTITGDGQVGINTNNPSARLTINQSSQTLGTGLSFRDNTSNLDWHITHGFALRFHYGNTLKSLINPITGAYTVSSDVNLKFNIQNINTVLDRVKRLRPKSYSYKDDASNTKALGFIAQEVEPIFPEVVNYSEADALYGVDYDAFGVIAIKAIQEQQVIIENQQKQINELKALVTTLLNKQ